MSPRSLVNYYKLIKNTKFNIGDIVMVKYQPVHLKTHKLLKFKRPTIVFCFFPC